MNSYIKSWKYQAYDHAKEILKNKETVSGMYFADAYRKLLTPVGLSPDEQQDIAYLMECNILCVGFDDSGDVEVVCK